MEVKGSAVLTTYNFVRERYGEDGLKTWLSQLEPETRKIFEAGVLVSSWYPLKQMLSVPTGKLCEIFFNGDIRGAWNCGRYSADYGLKGIYKIFIKLGSPGFLVSRASMIFPTYYKPCKMEVVLNEKDHATVRITEFPEMDSLVEGRIGGWIGRALEISGCQRVEVNFSRSTTTSGSFDDINASWSN